VVCPVFARFALRRVPGGGEMLWIREKCFIKKIAGQRSDVSGVAVTLIKLINMLTIMLY